MEAPPQAEELLKKIQELEAGHAHLKQAMSKLMDSSDQKPDRHQRSHSVSPQRSEAPPQRRSGGRDGAAAMLKKGSASFRNSSPLQRESRSGDTLNSSASGGRFGPAAFKFTDKQYVNVLQSMGQSVHILDLNFRIIYW